MFTHTFDKILIKTKTMLLYLKSLIALHRTDSIQKIIDWNVSFWV